MSLWKLTNQYLDLKRAIEENPDLDPDAVADTLDAIEDDMKVKYDNIWTITKDLDAEIKEKQEYVKQQHADIKRLKAQQERLKKYALQEIKASGKAKVTTDHYKLSIRHGHKAQIDDVNLLPKAYWRQPEPVVDKKKITAALRKGEKVAGAQLVETESLQGR